MTIIFSYEDDLTDERSEAEVASLVKLLGLPPADVIEKDGDLLINRFSLAALTGRFHNRRIVIRNGVRKDKPFSIRMYNATEVCSLFQRAGLVEYHLIDRDGQPLSADSRRIIAIAKKRPASAATF